MSRALDDLGARASPVCAAAQPAPLLEVEELTIDVALRERRVRLVQSVSFRVARGETLCILGESGSGKSLTLRALMRLLPSSFKTSGRVSIAGTDISALSPRELRRIRGPLVSMIFQEPASALDPVYTIGRQIAETIRAHEPVSRRGARRRALELLELVQIPSPERRLDAYPHELSGGLRQRAMIAVALSCRPALLLADEPTTALDATVQVQILMLLRKLQQELGMTTIFVTHDIGAASEAADRIAVMYAGSFVETGAAEDVLAQPAHPYTQGLLNAVVGRNQDARLTPIPGSPPEPDARPPGCAFAPRCPRVSDPCSAALPPLFVNAPDRTARCILFDPAHHAALADHEF